MALRELADIVLDACPDADVTVMPGRLAPRSALVTVYADDWAMEFEVTAQAAASANRDKFVALVRDSARSIALGKKPSHEAFRPVSFESRVEEEG